MLGWIVLLLSCCWLDDVPDRDSQLLCQELPLFSHLWLPILFVHLVIKVTKLSELRFRFCSLGILQQDDRVVQKYHRVS